MVRMCYSRALYTVRHPSSHNAAAATAWLHLAIFLLTSPRPQLRSQIERHGLSLYYMNARTKTKEIQIASTGILLRDVINSSKFGLGVR
jgi:hypothetical protein